MNVYLDGWKNKKGTAERACSCGSWKQHWINYSGQSWPYICSVEGCYKTAEMGAHVYNSNFGAKEYIIPTCTSCNGKDETFSIKAGTVPVPANVSETCGKKLDTKRHF